MHDSFFTYNLTRPYPFRWFTPVTIIGGIIIAILVSFFNYASTGYELVQQPSSDPNATIVDPSSYGGIHFPSYFTASSRATCASTTLAPNALIFTQNNAIPYTLTSVWRTKDDGSRLNLGSLVYHNNMLQDCNVSRISIDVLGKYTMNQQIRAASPVGLSVDAFVTCSVLIDTPERVQRPTYFEIKGNYKLIGPEVKPFLSRNKTSSTSLWWGESMLYMYWLVTAKAYIDSAEDTEAGKSQTYNAAITLRRKDSTDNGTGEETMSDDFFTTECYVESSFCGTNVTSELADLSKAKEKWHPYPKIWSRVNLLGKAMYFTVLADLGRNDSTVPNMLTHPNLLANLTTNLTSEVQWWSSARAAAKSKNESFAPHWDADDGLAQKTFDSNQTPQPSLGAAPAFMSTNYICQVPRAKAPGTMFFTILVADLVLLQSFWAVFRLVIDTVSQRKDPRLIYCAGCIEKETYTGSMELMGRGGVQLDSRTSLAVW
ncbi:hypothetical protein PG994_006071 [Apiospora phragmitis]|uniref:Uncharacterized protein n=1 Tax=Apiospora phragmitis TaxID=2905665 RepID=A0ABR1VGS2_9PEZI